MKDKLITQLLRDDFAEALFKEFGLTKSSIEIKTSFLDRLGELLLKRLALEILKKLPQEEHAKFDELLFAGLGTEKMYDLLKPHVGDVDAFVAKVMQDEIVAMQKETVETA